MIVLATNPDSVAALAERCSVDQFIVGFAVGEDDLAFRG
jgi:hypothetical protein